MNKSGISSLVIGMVIVGTAAIVLISNKINNDKYSEHAVASNSQQQKPNTSDATNPWWEGKSQQEVCLAHVPPEQSYCVNMEVNSLNSEIMSIITPASMGSETIAISSSDCDKATVDGGLAGKGNRYCVIEESGGDRTWQVNERR